MAFSRCSQAGSRPSLAAIARPQHAAAASRSGAQPGVTRSITAWTAALLLKSLMTTLMRLKMGMT
jgi:hypothetical protein